MTRITNLHRSGLDFEVARGADGARRFEHIKKGEVRDIEVSPADPVVDGRRRAGMIRIGPVVTPPPRAPLPAPPQSLLNKAAPRRRSRKGAKS